MRSVPRLACRVEAAHALACDAVQEEPDVGEARFLRNHRAAVESLMHKYGEQMLKVFHDHSFTFSSNMSWGALISQVGHDNASADLLSMVRIIIPFDPSFLVTDGHAAHAHTHTHTPRPHAHAGK
jgi:hypothetical protein